MISLICLLFVCSFVSCRAGRRPPAVDQIVHGSGVSPSERGVIEFVPHYYDSCAKFSSALSTLLLANVLQTDLSKNELLASKLSAWHDPASMVDGLFYSSGVVKLFRGDLREGQHAQVRWIDSKTVCGRLYVESALLAVECVGIKWDNSYPIEAPFGLCEVSSG